MLLMGEGFEDRLVDFSGRRHDICYDSTKKQRSVFRITAGYPTNTSPVASTRDLAADCDELKTPCFLCVFVCTCLTKTEGSGDGLWLLIRQAPKLTSLQWVSPSELADLEA